YIDQFCCLVACVLAHCAIFQIHRQINIDCDKGNICSGFTALLHSHKAIAVSFRGTTNPLQLLDEAIKSIINSWVTGHSLGGAMASLAAHAIVGSGIADSKKLKLITLGQPRTGDKVFAKNHTASIDYSFRVTHWRDVVPHIPSFDERPAGYYHHKSEVMSNSKV
ncbi:triacylglycerol lipase, partial [Ancylostoma ceylanicum]